jgi:hypothetical protein
MDCSQLLLLMAPAVQQGYAYLLLQMLTWLALLAMLRARNLTSPTLQTPDH